MIEAKYYNTGLQDDDFGIEDAPAPAPPMTSDDESQQHQLETEVSDNNATDKEPAGPETSDESPEEAAPSKKSKFSLKINLKKEKPEKAEKEEKAESQRPKPAKFFKSPSFKSPSPGTGSRRTPKTSPGVNFIKLFFLRH